MAKKQEQAGRFNLVTSEDSFVSQDAQSPLTARQVKSFIPSSSGLLTRESGEAKYLPTQLGSPSAVGALFQYAYNDTSGVRQTKQFAATSTQLFVESGGAWSVVTLPTNLGLTSTSGLVDYPQFVVINNLLHFSDGATNWIYDGPNNAYVIDGFPIPLFPPNFDITPVGTLNCAVGVYYWFTFADETSGRAHESSSSLISGSSGALVNKKPRVFPLQNSGVTSTTIGSKNVSSTSDNFFSNMVGMHFWVGGVDYGAIATFTDSKNIILAANAPATNTNINFIIAPARATHLHFYRSETDGSKLGKYLASLQIAGNPNSFLDDQAAFITDPTSTILNIDRPIRNDAAPASKIIEMHKYRLWRRRESKPNFFNFTANEEVTSGNGNGAGPESVPGADVHTLSDLINEFSYPKPANRLRAIKSHAEALYLGTDNEIIPLYGDSIDDFGLSQVTAIDGGVISRWGMESTAHGLAIFQFDRTIKLFPQITPYASFVPKDVDVSSQLQEIGRSLRKKLLAIKSADQDNVRICKYKFNSRDWLVTCWQDNASVYHTYVYDFEIKSWFELQRGFASLAVFEPTAGNKVLVGGGTDGFVYVVDDLAGQFTPNATFPSAIFRTALIDFGNPAAQHLPDYLEFEVSNNALAAQSLTVNFYLDPIDADNPGTPIQLDTIAEVLTGDGSSTNLFRGYFAPANGGTQVLCKRMMVEFLLASDTNAGSLRSIVLKSDPVPETLR